MKKFFLITMFLGFAMVSSAWATSFSITLDTEFSGATLPDGTVTVTFDDSGTAGSVDMTISNNLVGSEYMSNFYFNFGAPGLFSSWAYNTPSYNGITSFDYSSNSHKADGDGAFDFLITFDNAPPSDRFTGGKNLDITLTGTDIMADSFKYLSEGAANSPGGLYVAAQIGGIGEQGNDSGWITGDLDNGPDPAEIPEPATFMLFGVGLLGLARISRKKK